MSLLIRDGDIVTIEDGMTFIEPGPGNAAKSGGKRIEIKDSWGKKEKGKF